MTALSFENNNTGSTKLQHDDTSVNDYVVTLPHKSCTIAGTDEVALKAPLASPTFTGTVTLPSTTSIGNASSTEIGYLDGVTSAIQTQLSYAKGFLDSGATGATCDAMFKSISNNSSGWCECSAVADAPNAGWWMIHSIRHSNGTNFWGTQLAYGWEDNPNKLYQRNISAGTWSGWVQVGASSGVGISQTWQNVAGSRAIGTTYTNSTGLPIFVIIKINGPSVGNSFSATCSGVTLATETIASSGYTMFAFIVPNAATYSANIVSGSVSAYTWVELR